MAGDVGLDEALFVAAPHGMAPMAAPGPLIHDYGPTIKISLGRARDSAPPNLDAITDTERQGLEAFKLRNSKAYKDEKAARPFKSAAWGGEDGSPTLHLDRTVIVPGAAPEAGGHPDAPEAKRLSGRVAVGIVIVSGPGGLAMTDDHQRKIVAEVQNGLTFLAGRAPARDVTFAYDIQVVTIDTPDTTDGPPAGTDAYEHYEKPWRDAALRKMNRAPGGTGIRDYIRDIKAKNRAQSGYCAFFTHYTLNHFAYCSGSYLTMSYANDGWGPDNLDSVFAHETGHVFGAPDEYAESGCDCGGAWGFYRRPNLNCESCADGGGVSCIMKRNSWDMCPETPYHLGYRMPDEVA